MKKYVHLICVLPEESNVFLRYKKVLAMAYEITVRVKCKLMNKLLLHSRCYILHYISAVSTLSFLTE